MADAGAEVSARKLARGLWLMARPSQVALIVLVYALGLSMAAGLGSRLEPSTAFWGLLPLLPSAASVHYANEYADYETDALTTRTPFSGGSGAFVETELPRRTALAASVVAGAVGLGLLVAVGPRSVAAVGLLLAILLAGWQYSLPPLQFAWHGLGALTNALIGGVLLPLYGYAVVTDTVTTTAALATIPFALVVFVNLLETTWPDRSADAAVGKRTLVARLPVRSVRALYVVGSVAAAGSVLVLAGSVLPLPVAVVTLAPMVGLAWGIARFTRREAPLPAVLTMVVVAAASTAGWLAVAMEHGTLPAIG